jgi:hypothetical protein
MASVVIVDEVVVGVPRSALLDLLSDRTRWASWWPGSEAMLLREVPDERLEWALSGALVGSSTVVVATHARGVLVQYRLDADPAEPGSRTRPRPLGDSPHGRREAREIRQRHQMAWRRSVWAVASHYGDVPQARDPRLGA